MKQNVVLEAVLIQNRATKKTKEHEMDRLERVNQEFMKWYAEQDGSIDFHSASSAWASCHVFIEKEYLEDFCKMHHLYLNIKSSSDVPPEPL